MEGTTSRPLGFGAAASLAIFASVVVLGVSPVPAWQSGSAESAQDVGFVKIDEANFRTSATKSWMPTYPSASLLRKLEGVAVASVLVAPDGRVERVDVLQAPDAQIERAVVDAVKGWLFTPVHVRGASQPMKMLGKLVFYFQISPTGGRVLTPDQVGGDVKPGPAGEPAKEIDEAELRRLLATTRATILDIRERGAFKVGHRDGAVNIPSDELAARARVELKGAELLVIDCSQVDAMLCTSAARKLQGFGLAQVFLVR